MTDRLLADRPLTDRPLAAIIPAAGLGTRMRPATEAVPKELLPIGGRPAIDWVLEEAWVSGIEHVVVVTGPHKPALDAYLSAHCADGWHPTGTYVPLHGDDWRIEPALQVTLARQDVPRGLGDAVRIGWNALDDAAAATTAGSTTTAAATAVAVLLPDELMLGGAVLLSSMLGHHERAGSSVAAVMAVPREEISRYGCARLSGIGPHDTVAIAGCVEKPPPALAPSSFALCGRYVLESDVRELLDDVVPDAGGEIQLTPALDATARSRGLIGLRTLDGDGRVDVGNWHGWLEANRFAFEREQVFDRPRHLALGAG